MHALQLEMAQAAYMDEAQTAEYDSAASAPLRAVLNQLVQVLTDWKV